LTNPARTSKRKAQRKRCSPCSKRKKSSARRRRFRLLARIVQDWDFERRIRLHRDRSSKKYFPREYL
jgi:hypothetical protein